MGKILDDIANQHGYVPPDDGYAPGTTADGPWGSITALQEALVAAGFDPGPIDGIMGPLTRAAMEAFNVSIGGSGWSLSADDWAVLTGEGTPDGGTPVDGPWGTGEALQEALLAAGFDPGPIDGIIGPLTRAAMEAFNVSIGGSGWGISADDWAVLQETSPLPGNLPDDGTGSGYLTESWLAQIPELKAFIDEWAVKFEDEDFPPDSAMAQDLENDFLNALMKTDWWKSSSGLWRYSEQMRIEDPASWELQRDIDRKDVKMIATALGYPLNDEEIEWFANFVARTGATDIEIQRAIMDKFYYEKTTEDGTYAEAMGRGRIGVGSIRGEYDRLKEFARDNLISIKDERLWEYAHDINSEKRTAESIDQIVTDFTKVRYDFLQPDFIDRLHGSGQTISDYLDPVRNAVASVWEIDPRELSLTNEWFSDNLLVNEDGTERFINTREARLLAHQDERYKSTDAFKGKMSNFSNSVMQAFGAV